VAGSHRRAVRLAGGVRRWRAAGVSRLCGGELDRHHAERPDSHGIRTMTESMLEPASRSSATIAPTHATLCRIHDEDLKLELVGPEDGFFEVGGDSVLAVQVVARAREAGLVLGVRDLFDHQTAETLAAVIGELPSAGGDSADSTASEKS